MAVESTDAAAGRQESAASISQIAGIVENVKGIVENDSRETAKFRTQDRDRKASIIRKVLKMHFRKTIRKKKTVPGSTSERRLSLVPGSSGQGFL